MNKKPNTLSLVVSDSTGGEVVSEISLVEIQNLYNKHNNETVLKDALYSIFKQTVDRMKTPINS